jgi:hypothetical protein
MPAGSTHSVCFHIAEKERPPVFPAQSAVFRFRCLAIVAIGAESRFVVFSWLLPMLLIF